MLGPWVVPITGKDTGILVTSLSRMFQRTSLKPEYDKLYSGRLFLHIKDILLVSYSWHSISKDSLYIKDNLIGMTVRLLDMHDGDH